MWICSCHAVTDGMIKEFAKAHGCAWKKMTKELKVGTQCGTCAKSAKKILEEAAGKPKRKRKRKQKAAGENLLPGPTAQSFATPETTPPASSPALLPCGKCTCTCGK